MSMIIGCPSGLNFRVESDPDPAFFQAFFLLQWLQDWGCLTFPKAERTDASTPLATPLIPLTAYIPEWSVDPQTMKALLSVKLQRWAVRDEDNCVSRDPVDL